MTDRATAAVKRFDAHYDRISAISAGATMVHFDTQTSGPKGGFRTRAKAEAGLQNEAFRLIVSGETKEILDELEAVGPELSVEDAAKLRLAKRQYENLVNVPQDVQQAFRAQIIRANEIWERAKNGGGYALFAPELKKNIELQAQVTRLGKTKMVEERGLYNALLDDYEPGLTTDVCDQFFGKLRGRIVPLLKRVTESKKVIDRSFANIPVPVDVQRAIGRKLAEIIGFDFNRGEIRETEHPFCTGLSKYDQRITTHYHEAEFLSSVFSVLHESGHAIYEQGKDDAIAETILDDGVSMGIHESQSRFYENVVGRSEAFWQFAWPQIKPMLGSAFAHVAPRMVYEAANVAKAGLIRIEADELTYALHIMVRYELEREIFANPGNVDVGKLPAMWNAKYKEYLGIDVPDDARGILQDVHWSDALFGYFPSYALGNAYGAHLLTYMRKAFDVDEAVGKGDIAKVTAWLNKHIHRFGSVYEPGALFKNIAGEDMDAEHFCKYLEDKYAKIYEL